MATARFMETWAHSVDVHDALGVEAPRSDRVRHVAFLGATTRSVAFTVNQRTAPEEPVFVSLTLPTGAIWAHGPRDAADSVTGTAYDFALRVTQRRHRDDLDLVARGPVAEEWLDIVQAFAGPPEQGEPRRARRRYPAPRSVAQECCLCALRRTSRTSERQARADSITLVKAAEPWMWPAWREKVALTPA